MFSGDFLTILKLWILNSSKEWMHGCGAGGKEGRRRGEMRYDVVA
jgi:hypothetical protein